MSIEVNKDCSRWPITAPMIDWNRICKRTLPASREGRLENVRVKEATAGRYHRSEAGRREGRGPPPGDRSLMADPRHRSGAGDPGPASSRTAKGRGGTAIVLLLSLRFMILVRFLVYCSRSARKEVLGSRS